MDSSLCDHEIKEDPVVQSLSPLGCREFRGVAFETVSGVRREEEVLQGFDHFLCLKKFTFKMTWKRGLLPKVL